MSLDQVLAVSGILATIAFGVLALVFYPKLRQKNKRQDQSVTGGSIGIQSGRDTNIGPKS